MVEEGAASFKGALLRSHVAIRDRSPLALPAHCTTGVDGRHRERHRRDQEPARLRRVLQMGCLGASRGWWLVALSFFAAALVIKARFTMAHVAPTPRLPMWAAARFLEFDDPTFSGSMGDAPVTLYSWLAMETA